MGRGSNETSVPPRIPIPKCLPHHRHDDELELLVQSGFTPFEALRSATFYPAMFFTQLNNYGVIETTRRADLVLLDENPLADIRNARKISGVIMDGRYYSRKDLDTMLAQAESVAGTEMPSAAPAGK